MTFMFALCVALNACASAVNFAAGNVLAGAIFAVATVIWIAVLVGGR